jgi:hypothetical protein
VLVIVGASGARVSSVWGSVRTGPTLPAPSVARISSVKSPSAAAVRSKACGLVQVFHVVRLPSRRSEHSNIAPASPLNDQVGERSRLVRGGDRSTRGLPGGAVSSTYPPLAAPLGVPTTLRARTANVYEPSGSAPSSTVRGLVQPPQSETTVPARSRRHSNVPPASPSNHQAGVRSRPSGAGIAVSLGTPGAEPTYAYACAAVALVFPAASRARTENSYCPSGPATG